MMDGSLRVTDLNLRQSVSNLLTYPRSERLPSPHILPTRTVLIFKTLLQHQPWSDKYSLTATKDFHELEEATSLLIAQQFDLLPSKFVKAALNVDYVSTEDLKKRESLIPSITAHRCLLTAEYLGDKSEIDFWRLVLYYINHTDQDVEPAEESELPVEEPTMRRERSSSLVSENPSLDSTFADLQLAAGFHPRSEESRKRSRFGSVSSRSVADGQQGHAPELLFLDPAKSLPEYFDLLCDEAMVRSKQTEKADLHETISSTYEQTQRSMQQRMPSSFFSSFFLRLACETKKKKNLCCRHLLGAK